MSQDKSWVECEGLSPSSADDFVDSDVRNAVLQLARTEGLKVAYETAMELCREKSTPGQERAAMVRTILEIGGVLNYRDREASEIKKQPHELSGEELEAAVAKARERLAKRSDAAPARIDAAGVLR